MATFSGSDDLQGAEFVDADLRGARATLHHRYAVRDLDAIEASTRREPATQ